MNKDTIKIKQALEADWLTIARKHGYAFPDKRMQEFVSELIAALSTEQQEAQPCRDDVRFAAVKECHRLHKEEGKDYYTFSFVAGWEAALRTQPAQQATTAEPSEPVQAVTDAELLAAFNSADSVIDGLHEVCRLISGSAKTATAEKGGEQ